VSCERSSFLFGEGDSIEHAREINSRFRNPHVVNEAFERVLDFWDQTLGAIEIKTPDASLDTLVNRWLLYQVLACRVRGRSAFYQSSGRVRLSRSVAGRDVTRLLAAGSRARADSPGGVATIQRG
jgi:cellobiose phosphorylase